MYYLLRQIALLRIALPFISGIISGIYFQLPVNIWLTVILIITFLCIAFITSKVSNFRLRWIYGVTISFIFFAAGYLWATANKAINKPNYFANIISNKHSTIVIEIDNPVQEKERSLKAVATVKAILSNGRTTKTSGNIQLYFSKSDSFLRVKYGDVYAIPAHKLQAFESPKNPYEFNYKNFMAFKQIHHQVFLRHGDYRLLERNKGISFLNNIYDFRAYLVKVLKKHVSNQQSFSIASSLLLGARENLDFHLIKAYSSSGAMHVLAVSGLHVAILYIIIEKLLFFLNRTPKLALIKAILIVIIIWSYAMLTGFSPSVQRASIMFTFITIGKQSERGYNIYNVLSASAIFQLLINPFAIMEVGFQLSYLAVTGIVMFQKFFYDILYIKNKILDYFWQITCVSIAAQIITFPVGLLYFYQFPLYFFVSNLFVIPAAFVIMLTGTILLAIHPIEEIAFWIGKLLNELIHFMNQCVFAVEQLPYSLIQGLSISILESWLIYLVVFLFFAYIHLRNSKIIIAITAIFTILTIINTVENIIQHNQKMFVVYSTPKNYAYDFIKGKENLLFAENRLTDNYSQMQFYIMHNWWNNDIRNHRFSPFYKKHNSSAFSNFHQYKNHIFFLGKRIVIIDEKLPENAPKNKLKVDWIILKNNPKVSIEKVLQHYSSSEIIADGTNSKWRSEKWLSESLKLKIKFTSVNHYGAFVKHL